MTMPDDKPSPATDWSLATFEGARREQLRRWSQLPLEDILRAIEEMHEIARQLGNDPRPGNSR
jgi:hypothetical protein